MRGTALREYAARADWGSVAAWAVPFGLVAYLGLKGGGYDPLVHDQVGIAIWWVLLLGALVGALPRRSPGTIAWAALGLLAAFVGWTALSLSWTESSGKTAAELALVATYLGAFGLVLFSRRGGDGPQLLGAVAAGIVLVALVGLLSRLHPAWFPEAAETGRILEDPERLSYPLNYWNGVAALIAIGLPLVLQVATTAKAVVLRALAAAALPALALTVFFTLSRGGIAAGAVALAVFFALTSDRLPKLLTLALAGGGGAILIAAADRRDALQEGLLGAAAREQGDELLAIAIVVCLAVGLAQAAISVALADGRRPEWTHPSRRHSLALTAAAAIAVLVAAVAVDLPGRAADGWDEFKEGGGPGAGTERLGSVAGQNRYQFWSAAVRQNETEPVTGTGSGTFEFWWARDGDSAETVRDAHSLYMQTLGELGIVGLALLAAFLATILIGGGRALLRAGSQERPQYAAALAGSVAFCLTAVVDWMWQIPVLPVALLSLATVLVSAEPRAEAEAPSGLPAPLRWALPIGAVAAIVAIAIPLASTSLLRDSEADARAGDLEAALRAAETAQSVQPGAAAPRLQQALVLEERGDLDAAAAAAAAASEREETNWRTWLVRSRLEAERGRAGAAVRFYRRARSLNPHFSLFSR
jgi:O-Antigen ligase